MRSCTFFSTKAWFSMSSVSSCVVVANGSAMHQSTRKASAVRGEVVEGGGLVGLTCLCVLRHKLRCQPEGLEGRLPDVRLQWVVHQEDGARNLHLVQVLGLDHGVA